MWTAVRSVQLAQGALAPQGMRAAQSMGRASKSIEDLSISQNTDTPGNARNPYGDELNQAGDALGRDFSAQPGTSIGSSSKLSTSVSYSSQDNVDNINPPNAPRNTENQGPAPAVSESVSANVDPNVQASSASVPLKVPPPNLPSGRVKN